MSNVRLLCAFLSHVANIRSGSNCDSWSGGKADFSGDNGNWIYGYKPGGPMESDDKEASITRHESAEAFKWSYADAQGGDSVNPLLNSSPTGTASGGATGTANCVPRPTTGTFASGATATATTATDDDSSGRPTGAPTGPPSGRWSGRPSGYPTGRPRYHFTSMFPE